MKACLVTQPAGFIPVTIQFTIESEEELQALVIASDSLISREIEGPYSTALKNHWISTFETIGTALHTLPNSRTERTPL